jgi:conjugative relaxase-like TrwC/TraI family protein
VLTLSSGHSADYLTGAVAAGRENYYTGAVAAGEPPGRWYGRGAKRLGLSGLVDTQDMTALYEHFIDPRDEAFADPARWDEAETLGHTGRKYLSEDDIYAAALAAEPGADAERRAALRVEAGKKARKNVTFIDATFSVQKSITVLHTAFEAQEVQARSAAEQARTALTALGIDASAPAGAAGAAGAPSSAVHPADNGAMHRLTRELADAETAADAWSAHRKAVEDAIWAGNQAALEYLTGKAGYSRIGHHGGAAGRWVDAHDWTIASFFQHDSRNHDPQLHIHNAILNRVEGSDGKWRTIDARAMYRYRGAASVVGDRVMEQHLTHVLGVEFATRPDGAAREIVGIEQGVMDLFSSRRRAITRKTQTLVKAFETKFGREPNALELDRLQRSAAFATRNAKSHDGETVEERLERWGSQLRGEVRGGLGQVAADVLERGPARGAKVKPQRWRPREVIETALADVQETKAAWTAPDLTRAISNALPDYLGQLSPEQVTELLDGLTEQALQLAVPLDAQRPGEHALPDEMRLGGGASAYQSPGARLFATPAHVHTERALSAAAVDRGAPSLAADKAAAMVVGLTGSGVELGADQAAAVRGILTSGATVETLVGPAGTGKSFVVGVLAKAWQDPALWSGTQHRVVGLASSQIATEVLAGEGLAARNIARWLATQDRLAENRPSGDDKAWRLRAGDLVVVDESAMADTSALAAIHAHCHAAGAKILLTGDHRQLAAVGAAGGMELVAAGGLRHELSETRRFTADWEGAASLRLRDGDQTVLGEYHKRGRLIDGGAVEQTEARAARAWLADTLAGQHSLLIVDTNEQAARLSAHLRAELVRLGRVDEHAVPLGMQGTFAGRGDLIQARSNGWELAGYEGNARGPINREHYRVLHTLDDGGLVVAPITGRTAASDGRAARERHGESMTLPAEYVAEHVALGYASTVHAAQGVTVDTCHTVATNATGVEALYVGMTRGRRANTAHVVTRAVPSLPDGAPTGQALQAMRRSPQAVLAGAFETADPQLSALAVAADSVAEAEAVRTPAELFADAAELATAGRTATWLDELVSDGTLTENQRVRLAAEDGAATLTTLLRRVELAGHDPREVLRDAVTSRQLGDARQITNVIHRRITETSTLDPIGSSYADWVPKVDDPQWAAYLASLAKDADKRRVELGRQVAEHAPQWAVETLGAVPDDSDARRAWQEQASIAAAHRELVGHNEPADALGPAPRPGQVEAYASWRAAWRALGRPEADRDEAEMSTGLLHVRVRAYDREQAWSPAYVANELAGTRQAAQRHRQDATVRAAEATAATDDNARARLHAEAEQAAALADALDARVTELEAVDEARAHWYAHTAETRAAADRARSELSARQAADDTTGIEREVTADDWLDQHRAAVEAEDPHRTITDDHDLTDLAEARENDQRTARRRDHDANVVDEAAAHADRDNSKHSRPADAASLNELVEDATTVPADPGAAPEPDANTADVDPGAGEIADGVPARAVLDHEPGLAPRDIRQEAGEEPARDDGHDPDTVRVPSTRETAESVRRAHRALAELKQRQAIDDRRAADEARERDDELVRWHSDDRSNGSESAETDTAAGREHEHSDANSVERPDAADEFASVLEVTPSDDY